MQIKITKLATVCLLAVGTGNVNASGFGIAEQNASGLGNAYAGVAAVAEDASTVFFNPAGMTLLPGRQFVVSASYIAPKASFTDTGSTINSALGGGSISGNNATSDENAVVPTFYYVQKLNADWMFGLGVNAPFGLATEYDETWSGRYHATRSEITTININPSFAYREGDVSFGFGVSAQYLEAKISNNIDSAAVCLGSALIALCPGWGIATPGDITDDTTQTLTGDDWSFGANFGVIWHLDKARVGLAYRSRIKQRLVGNVDFTSSTDFQNFVNATSLFQDTGAATELIMPQSIALSYVRDMSDKWTVLADYTWTDWSVVNVSTIRFENAQPDSTLELRLRDTSRYSVGLTYTPSSTWKFKMGLAYDQTAVQSPEFRTARLPGNDRSWITAGFSYQGSKDLRLDFGYAHLFISNTDINNTNSLGHTLTGTYESSVDIFSTQLTWAL